jgi:NAD(P)-dependent dehydrogenase (short-subunit alcohol dehydrogenase family)
MSNLSPARRTLIVTGGGRGIGAATARFAAARGYAVCVNYSKSQAEAEAIVDDIGRDGGMAISVKADVSSEGEVIELFARTEETLGPLAALVNNAGTLESQSPVAEMEADRIERVLLTNVMSAFLCSREAVRRMAKSRGGAGGAIVNVSSVAARLGAAGEYVDYAASKAALDALTIGLAQEVAQEGIRVNAVRPGFIYTDIHARGGEPERIDRVKQFVPMRRGGEPEEVARAILWLLSDEASYSTGTFLDVSGGRQ